MFISNLELSSSVIVFGLRCTGTMAVALCSLRLSKAVMCWTSEVVLVETASYSASWSERRAMSLVLT